MRVFASASAIRTITQQGGRLFLWQEPFSGDLVRDRYALQSPDDGTAFVIHNLEEQFEVLLAEELQPPDEMRISTRWLRPSKLKILWDGERWGWRGASAGVPSGSY